MSKEELNKEFESWIISEEFTPEKDKYQQFVNQMTELRAATEKEQQAAHAESEEAEEAFEYSNDKDDNRFQELKDIYHDKRKSHEKALKQELEDNLKKKKQLLAELKELIQDEENIGQAYKKFDEIKVGWEETGKVPTDKRRDLQSEYSRLIEQFYYNIKIYRELQQNDFKKNQELKLEVIEKIKTLEKESSINQVDFLIHQYLDEWDQIGPTFREEWDKIREEFKTSVSAVFDRIKAHRKEVKDEHHKNFEAKQELVEKVKAYADKDLDDVKVVQQYTREIIDIQKEWKKIGFAGRSKNDSVWADFRAACDDYFDRRKQFLDASNKEFAKVKERKRDLIDKAKEIYQGEDLDKIANTLKGLQREWKQTGKLLPQEEFKMFKEFRKYCDDFFNRKKNEVEAAQKELVENLKAKEELLESFTKELAEGIKEKGEATINDWKSKWSSVGQVLPKASKAVESNFTQLITDAYSSLGISKEEVEKKKFQAKIDILSNQENPIDSLKRERNALGAKIKEAQVNVAQLEGKLDFFKFSDDSNPLKKDVMSKIEEAQSQVDALRAKKKKIDLTIKELQNAQKEEEIPAEEASSEE